MTQWILQYIVVPIGIGVCSAGVSSWASFQIFMARHKERIGNLEGRVDSNHKRLNQREENSRDVIDRLARIEENVEFVKEKVCE